jgi:hypothetical protein
LNLSDGEKEITGGYTGDLLSWVMGRASCGNAWITIMSNINIIAVASLLDFFVYYSRRKCRSRSVGCIYSGGEKDKSASQCKKQL